MYNEIGLHASVDYPTLKLYHLDCGHSSGREVCNRFKMRGLPSIFLAHKGNVCKYDGKRSIEGILGYVGDCINGKLETEPLPSGRGEYTSWDRLYYYGMSWGDSFNESAQKHPVWTIFGIVIFCISLMGCLTFGINYFMDDDGYYPPEDEPK